VTTIGIIAIVIIAAISGSGTILTALALRKAVMNNDSKNLAAQIERIGQSLGGVVERIEGIGQTFETISTRNEQIRQTFDSIITRNEQTNQTVERLAEQNERTSQTLENITARNENISQMLNNILERSEQTSQSLGKVAERNEQSTRVLESIAERNEQVSQTFDSVVKHSERTSRVLERIVASNQDIIYKLDNIITRNEQTGRISARVAEQNENISKALTALEQRIELLSYRDELSGPGWQTKLRACQRQAARHEPAYVKTQPNNPAQYLPTDAGRAFLPTDLKNGITEILSEDASIENNELILSLGIPDLFETNQQKQAEFDVFLGVITSFANEIRNKA